VNSALYAGIWLLVAQTGGAGTGTTPPPNLSQERGVPSAPADTETDPASPPPAPAPYRGVVLGPEARNPLPQPGSDPPRLIWTGFKMDGDRSEIFLQITRPVAHEISRPGGKVSAGLSVLLRNCRIHMRNNARRIDTSFFATPVREISARQRRRDVELSIAVKHRAVPEIRVQPGPDGTHFVVLSFAPKRSVGDPERGATSPPPLAPNY
jgi:hypothetical protein